MKMILRLLRPNRNEYIVATLFVYAVSTMLQIPPCSAAFVMPPFTSSLSSSSGDASSKFRFSSSRTACMKMASDGTTSSSNVVKKKETAADEFRWETEWYPVSPLQDLDRHRPNKITLLGKDFVVWYNQPLDKWTAFADSCPHRLVPLSEGRIETKKSNDDNNKHEQFLQCAYHGWEFDTNGKCRLIPQLSDVSGASAIKNPRSCAPSYPVQLAQGLLWLFPTANQPALAASKTLPLIPELDDPDMMDGTNFFVRDMPYSWDVLVENLCDPAHVPFAHHSFMRGANRNPPNGRDSLQLNLILTQQSSRGFQATKDPRPTPPGQYDFTFTAPCLLYARIANSQALLSTTGTTKTKSGDTIANANTRDNTALLKRGNFIGLGQYCIPTAPGKSRLIARFPLRIPFPPAMWLMKHTPRWVNHFSQNIVMDSDVVFLCSQDEALNHPLSRSSSGSNSSNSRNQANYYLPGRCDLLVWTFRKWLATSGGGQPHWLGIPASRSGGDAASWLRPTSPSLASRREGRDALLDRYRQHTEICSSCKKAHQVLYRIRTVLQCAGVAGLILLASASSSSSTSVGTSMAMTTLNKILCGKRMILGILSAIALLIPPVVLRPVIARMECVPWPRKRWLFDSST
jgi:phenylpropionate dioxygenase-like ring-hydroxylating dioxygenase large terminal subunit